MNRKFGIGVLIFCFSLSSVNASLASQTIEISPIIVQPCDLREISQQMLEQDRINRDQELAIRGLIDDNQKAADTALARQQEATLDKINQTMIHYRDALLSRERARIAANSRQAPQYHDLIALTEDVDAMKGVGRTVQLKSDVIEGKYKILTELKDEMAALNRKLTEEARHKNFEKINQQQEDKIQLLTQRLGEMDQRVARLKDNLSRVQSEDTAKDQTIHWLKQVVAVAKNKAEYYQLTSQQDRLAMEQLQKEARQVMGRLGAQLSQKQQQVDLLKLKLEDKSIEADNQAQQEAQARRDLEARLQDKENQITAMKTAIQSGQGTQAPADTLKRQLADQQNKVDLLKEELDSKNSQSDQMTLMMSDYQKKLESKDNAYNQELRQVLLAKNNSSDGKTNCLFRCPITAKRSAGRQN